MSFEETGTLIFRFAKERMRATEWERDEFVALLLGPGYVPQFDHGIRDAEPFEISTQNYKRLPLTGRKAALDVKDERINLEAGDLTWDDLGTPVDGPVVAGMMVVRVSKTVDPVVYFRLESVQLNGQPYKLNLAENDAVMMRIT